MRSTSDLDREVRDLLRDRAGEAGEPPPFRPAVRRRVRGRQAAAMAGVAVVVALVVLPFVIAPTLFDDEDRVGSTEHVEPVTSTVYGVSITYPDDWTLLQLNDRLEMDGMETSSLFQLSNFDPLDGNAWVCPLPSGQIPVDGVVLFVQELLADVDMPAWPVDLAPGAATFDTCGRRVTRWQVDGRSFEAGVVGDLDGAAYTDLLEAFRSMTFEAPDDDPLLGAGEVTVSDAYVVASGRENGEPWNLLAFRYHEGFDNWLCILLDPIGKREGGCMPNPVQNYPFAFELSAAEAGGTLFAFGKVPSLTAGVETLAGRSLHLEPLPEGLRFPFDVFVGPADEQVVAGVALVEVRRVDSGGNVAERKQWIESLDEGVPGVKAFDHAFGELWWLYDDGERILLKTRAGHVQAIDDRLLPDREHLLVRTHTFAREVAGETEYETVVFGLSSGEGTQVTLVLSTGDVLNASTRTLEYEIRGPDMIDLGHVFWASLPGAVRGEVVAVDTGCRVLARVPLQPDTPPPSLPSPPPEPELPCIGP